MSRTAAITRAEKQFDSGEFKALLARRIAIPTESQNPDRGPVLEEVQEHRGSRAAIVGARDRAAARRGVPPAVADEAAVVMGAQEQRPPGGPRRPPGWHVHHEVRAAADRAAKEKVEGLDVDGQARGLQPVAERLLKGPVARGARMPRTKGDLPPYEVHERPGAVDRPSRACG